MISLSLSLPFSPHPVGQYIVLATRGLVFRTSTIYSSLFLNTWAFYITVSLKSVSNTSMLRLWIVLHVIIEISSFKILIVGIGVTNFVLGSLVFSVHIF